VSLPRRQCSLPDLAQDATAAARDGFDGFSQGCSPADPPCDKEDARRSDADERWRDERNAPSLLQFENNRVYLVALAMQTTRVSPLKSISARMTSSASQSTAFCSAGKRLGIFARFLAVPFSDRSPELQPAQKQPRLPNNPCTFESFIGGDLPVYLEVVGRAP